MTDTNLDAFFDAPPEDASESFKHKVTSLVREVRTLESETAKLEEQIKELTRRRVELETRTIPDALLEAGVRELTTLEGLKVSTKFVVGGIPAERKEEAFEWLATHGHGSLVKRNVSLKLDKGSDAIAEKAAQALRDLGLDPKISLEVHAQTWMAFAREQMQKGEQLPLAAWGVYFGEKAVIKD